MFYRRLTHGLVDKGILLPAYESPYTKINIDTDWYWSIFRYTQSQYDVFKNTGSIAGIEDVTTDKIVFDFDSKDNLQLAQSECFQLADRLLSLGFKESNLLISFSGFKGFGIEVKWDESASITVEEYRAIEAALAKDYATIDLGLCNAARIMRLSYTKHNTSNYYKTPISLHELRFATIEEIKSKAAIKPCAVSISWEVSDIEILNNLKYWYPITYVKPVEKVAEVKAEYSGEASPLDALDWKIKPKWLTNCRYAIQNGHFKEGGRNHAFMVMAATRKALGENQAIAYRFLKGVAETQAIVNDTDRYSETALWNEVICTVFSNTWAGGTYSCKTDGWLRDYCQSLGKYSCEHTKTEDVLVSTSEITAFFKDYSENYFENVLTTGIKSLDARAKFMVGTSNAFVASPGVGKTSLSLQILNHNSLNDIPCIFFSYDMFHAALYTRMLQRGTGYHQDDIYRDFKDRSPKCDKYVQHIDENYKNVQFCFKSGQTPHEIETTIDEYEQKAGKKVKLIIIDYNELVQTEMSDATQASAMVAQKIRQIANEKSVCAITLLQPSKLFSTPADIITNFNAAKGSSSITQSLTLMLSCSRPGFNPQDPSYDKFMNLTCLKNRNGQLFSIDLGWDGVRGNISTLSPADLMELSQIRASIELKKKEQQSSGWGNVKK